MERHLDNELQLLNENILKMAAMTEQYIHDSIEALKDRDIIRAEELIQRDKQIDAMENLIEEHAIELLALFQPLAGDLRFITMGGMRINSELELISDLVVNICQRTIEIADRPILKPLETIPELANRAKWMIRNSIDAFVKKDEFLAKEVILSDKQADQLRTTIIKDIVDHYIIKDGACAPRAIPLILIARDLERICDHAAAIAEDVIYLIQAKVVKHHREILSVKDQKL